MFGVCVTITHLVFLFHTSYRSLYNIFTLYLHMVRGDRVNKQESVLGIREIFLMLHICNQHMVK